MVSCGPGSATHAGALHRAREDTKLIWRSQKNTAPFVPATRPMRSHRGTSKSTDATGRALSSSPRNLAVHPDARTGGARQGACVFDRERRNTAAPARRLLIEEIEIAAISSAWSEQRRALRRAARSKSNMLRGRSGSASFARHVRTTRNAGGSTASFRPQRERPCPMCTSLCAPGDGATVPDIRQRVALAGWSRSPDPKRLSRSALALLAPSAAYRESPPNFARLSRADRNGGWVLTTRRSRCARGRTHNQNILGAPR